MHTVAILALDGTVAFDMATPIELFGRVRLPDGRRVGAENRVTLCDLLVLVDESTETIAPKNVKTAAGF